MNEKSPGEFLRLLSMESISSRKKLIDIIFLILKWHLKLNLNDITLTTDSR